MSDDDFGLVMPFVVCTSNGGPYDDAAYVAGYEAGRYDQLLDGTQQLTDIVRTDNVPQLDLIAMRHGLTLVAEEVGDGWSHIDLVAERDQRPETDA